MDSAKSEGQRSVRRWVLCFQTYYSGFMVSAEKIYVGRMSLRERSCQNLNVISDMTLSREG